MCPSTRVRNSETSSARQDAQILAARTWSCSALDATARRASRPTRMRWPLPGASRLPGRPRLKDVTREHLSRYRPWLDEHGFQPASLHLFLRVVRKFFAWLEEHGTSSSIPPRAWPRRRRHGSCCPCPARKKWSGCCRRPDTCTPVGVRDRALMEIAYGCALRREELAELTLSNMDLDRQLLRILGKGRKERVVPLGRQGADWLARYVREARPVLLGRRADEDRLWVGQRSGFLTGQAIHVLLKKYARAAGIETPITPHSLRRACASHMLDRGAHPVQIQLLLGHASLRHLSSYLRVGIRDMKKIHARCNPGR